MTAAFEMQLVEMQLVEHPADAGGARFTALSDSAFEWRILGHLLGRRETAGSVAAALHLPLAQVEAACEALGAAGKLAAEPSGRGQLYRVRLRAAKEG